MNSRPVSRASRSVTVERLQGRALFAAADGAIDPTFGDGGVMAYPDMNLHQVTALPDGRVAVITGGPGMEVAVIGLDGKLDPAFGGDGKAAGAVPDDEEAGIRLAVQGDGKIVVATTGGPPGQNALVLARYNADGTRDSTFNGDGKVEVPGFRAGPIAVRTDGRIVVAGDPYVQFAPDGAMEAAAVEPPTSATYNPRAAAMPDGSVVVGTAFKHRDGENFTFTTWSGAGSHGSTDHAVVWPRLTRQVVDWNPVRFRRGMSTTSATLTDVTVQPDGKILATGYVRTGALGDQPHAIVMRLNPDRTRDETFGKYGVFRLPDKSYGSEPRDVDVLPDGKVIVGLDITRNRGRGPSYAAVLRLTPDGKPDRRFGRGGFSRAMGEPFGSIADVTVQPDGKYVVHGSPKVGSSAIAARFIVDEARRK